VSRMVASAHDGNEEFARSMRNPIRRATVHSISPPVLRQSRTRRPLHYAMQPENEGFGGTQFPRPQPTSVYHGLGRCDGFAGKELNGVGSPTVAKVAAPPNVVETASMSGKTTSRGRKGDMVN